MTIYDSKGAYVWRGNYNIGLPYERMEVQMNKFGKGVYHIVLTNQSGKRLAMGSVVIQ